MTNTTIQGRFATITDDSVRRMAKRVGLTEQEIRDFIRETRWKEAKQWLDEYVRPWLYAIHDRKSAVYAMEHMPPEWITGDDHIDAVTGAYATHMVDAYTRRHLEERERSREIARIMPPRVRLKRHEKRELDRALKKNPGVILPNREADKTAIMHYLTQPVA